MYMGDCEGYHKTNCSFWVHVLARELLTAFLKDVEQRGNDFWARPTYNIPPRHSPNRYCASSTLMALNEA